MWAAWGSLSDSVRTGQNAFEALHGVDMWTHRQGHPEHNAIFNDNMTALSSSVAGAVASAYDFAGLTSVVDVGGGKGILLEAVLTGHEHLTGTVFDLDHVVAKAPMSDAPSGRWAAATGSFFESVPAADAYLLKSILHDWPDDRCVEILRTCVRSLNPDGVVLVVETVLGRPGYEVEAAFSDLNMLVHARRPRTQRGGVRRPVPRRRPPPHPGHRHRHPDVHRRGQGGIVREEMAPPTGVSGAISSRTTDLGLGHPGTMTAWTTTAGARDRDIL